MTWLTREESRADRLGHDGATATGIQGRLVVLGGATLNRRRPASCLVGGGFCVVTRRRPLQDSNLRTRLRRPVCDISLTCVNDCLVQRVGHSGAASMDGSVVCQGSFDGPILRYEWGIAVPMWMG